MPEPASNVARRNPFKSSLLIAALSVLALSAAKPAFSAEAVFEMRNLYSDNIQIIFFSQTRDHAWPGGDRSYNLHGTKIQKFRLTCERGEKICYGAWATNDEDTYWGLGPDGDEGCDNCCLICGSGQTKKMDLE